MNKDILVLFGTLLAIAVAIGGVLHAGRPSPPEETTIPGSSEGYREAVSGEAPQRLLIPAIGVDAAVEHVGIAPSGNMAVPYAYENAGWYRSGPMPGEKGSAVMDGHVDTGFGTPAVFARIDELSPGDLVHVRAGDGSELSFRVEEVEEYGYDDVPKEKLFLRDDAPRLNLVTCAGEWDQGSRSYDRRVVAYARLVVD